MLALVTTFVAGAIMSWPIPGAHGWLLAKDEDQPYCFAERRGPRELVAVSFDAVQEKSSILFLRRKSEPVVVSPDDPLRIIVTKNSSYLRELKGMKSFRLEPSEDGGVGIIFETRIRNYLGELPDGDHISVFNSDKLVVSVESPFLQIAVHAVIECSRRSKTELLHSL